METITLHINGQTVETVEGKSVLEAALDAGIYIPHLCYHADLASIGACRLCVVEIEGLGGIPPACMTAAEAGMSVRTSTPKVEQMRRLAMELMLAAHPSDCTGCPKYMKCELQSLAQFLGVSPERFRRRPPEVSPDAGNPLIVHDMTRCVKCGRCVRACGELRGVKVLDYQNREGETRIGTQDRLPLAEAGCRFCGACIAVCPTGALRDQEGLFSSETTGVSGRETALVPCRSACPAGVDIPRYVRYVKEKNYSAATAVIREKVPFPLVLGHVCDHRCEDACRRKAINEPVSICGLKRFAAENDDKAWKSAVRPAPPTHKRVAIIGAGPAGLTAGYYLARLGHAVTVFEAQDKPGGQCRVGIPEYRLPRPILDDEIEEIQRAGLEIATNTRVESLDDLFSEGYQAVLVAVGTHRGVVLPVPGSGLAGVCTSTSFLKEVSLKEIRMREGSRVVILGGGNVAFDCGRAALRLGAAEVHLACLEGKSQMPASPEEIEQGEEEGIILHPSLSACEILGDRGRVAGVRFFGVKSFAFDEAGKAQIEVDTGSVQLIQAETVIFAVGQKPDVPAGFGLAVGRAGLIQVNSETMMAGRPGVFAAGDAVTGTKSVIAAIAAGRKAADSIDKFLGGDGLPEERLVPLETPSPWIGRIKGFAGQTRNVPACTPAAERIRNFNPVDTCFDDETACREAERCLQCDLRLNIGRPRFWSEFPAAK